MRLLRMIPLLALLAAPAFSLTACDYDDHDADHVRERRDVIVVPGHDRYDRGEVDHRDMDHRDMDHRDVNRDYHDDYDHR